MTVEPELAGSTFVEEGAREAAAPEWGPVKRILFRFAFSYLSLYLPPLFLQALALLPIPHGDAPIVWYYQLLLPVVLWAGRHLLGVAAIPHPTGSGDTMADWVAAFCGLVLALAATLEGHKVRASLHRVEEPKFLLLTRGFHWVSEDPFNR